MSLGGGSMSTEQAIQTCTECGGKIRSADNETVCESCGLVIDESEIDYGPEWRSLDEDTDARRTGAPRSRARHDRGLSTEIGYGNGSEVSPERKRQFARLRRQHNRARISSKAERNKLYAYTEIRRLVSRLSLSSSIRDQACSLFDSAQEVDLLRGRSLEGFSAATVYAACRTQSLARTMDEVVSDARATKEELKVAYDALNRNLNLPTGPIDPTEYMPRYASELDMDTEVERRAREYAVTFKQRGLMGGKNPSGVAAACLYKAAVEHDVDVTQSQVADLADVSRMTISSTATDLDRLHSG